MVRPHCTVGLLYNSRLRKKQRITENKQNIQTNKQTNKQAAASSYLRLIYGEFQVRQLEWFCGS